MLGCVTFLQAIAKVYGYLFEPLKFIRLGATYVPAECCYVSNIAACVSGPPVTVLLHNDCSVRHLSTASDNSVSLFPHRSEKEQRDQHRRGQENGTSRERKRPTKRERQELAAAQRVKKAREEADDLPHTKTTITQNSELYFCADSFPR